MFVCSVFFCAASVASVGIACVDWDRSGLIVGGSGKFTCRMTACWIRAKSLKGPRVTPDTTRRHYKSFSDTKSACAPDELAQQSR